MSLKKLGKDVVAYGLADLLFRGAQFLVLPVYASVLSVADFGLLALVTVSATLVGMVLNLGVNNSVQRFYFDTLTLETERPALVSTGLAQLALVSILGLALCYFGLSLFRQELYRSFGIEWLLVVLALLTVLPEQIAQYCLDAVRLQFAPLRYLLISAIKNALGVCLGLWFLLRMDMGIAGILLGTLLAAVLAVPLGLLMIRRDLTIRFNRAVVVKVLKFGYPFVLAGAAYWVFGSMDRWMLANFSTVDEVGLFSVAFKIAAVLSFVMSAFGQAWSPYAYKTYSEDAAYRQFFSQILSLWLFLLSFLALGMGLFSRELLMLLTPEEYWGASPILALAVAGTALYGTTLVTSIGISLEKKTHLLSASAWLAALTNFALNLVLIPHFGGMGAACATLVSYTVLTGALLYWSQRHHPVPLEHGKLLYSCIVLALTISAAALSARPPAASEVALKLLGMLLVLAGAFLFQVLDAKLLLRLARQLTRGKTASELDAPQT